MQAGGGGAGASLRSRPRAHGLREMLFFADWRRRRVSRVGTQGAHRGPQEGHPGFETGILSHSFTDIAPAGPSGRHSFLSQSSSDL